MRRSIVLGLLAAFIVLGALLLHRETAALASEDDDFPEMGALDMKSYLRRLQTKSGANWVLQHGSRAFVVQRVLEDGVILVELETEEGEPLETSDSTPPEDRIKAIWKHGRNEPSTFRRMATWMVPFTAILRVSHRSLEGHERFTLKLVGLD